MCVKIIPVYQSFKLLKSNCFAVEILFNEDKMASFFSIAKSGFKRRTGNDTDILSKKPGEKEVILLAVWHSSIL